MLEDKLYTVYLITAIITMNKVNIYKHSNYFELTKRLRVSGV